MFRRQAYRQSIIYNCHLLTLLRDSINTSLGTISPGRLDMEVDQKAVFLEDLRKAVYAAILACFIQGLDLSSSGKCTRGVGCEPSTCSQNLESWLYKAGCQRVSK